MIQKIKSLLTKASVVLLFAVPMMVPVAVHAESLGGQAECGAQFQISNASNGTTGCGTDNTSGSKIDKILSLVINILSIIVGFIAVIMIIVGGIKYVMSGGNDANISSAKNTILFALIGLVIVALAQILVKFVINKVTTTAG